MQPHLTQLTPEQVEGLPSQWNTRGNDEEEKMYPGSQSRAPYPGRTPLLYPMPDIRSIIRPDTSPKLSAPTSPPMIAASPAVRPSGRGRMLRRLAERAHRRYEPEVTDVAVTDVEANSMKRWFARLSSREFQQFPMEFESIWESVLSIRRKQDLQQKRSLGHLPHEVLQHTLMFLDSASLGRCARSCRQLRDLTEDVAKLMCASVDYKPLGGTLSWKAMLRAHEMITGVPGPIVPIPCISLRSLVQVINAGKLEVNGLYVNNEISANGHVFARKAHGKMYTICKMFSGAQLYWYMREDDVPMYWAALTLEGAGRPYGFPPRDWNAFENHQSPAPQVFILNAKTLERSPQLPLVNQVPSMTATSPQPDVQRGASC